MRYLFFISFYFVPLLTWSQTNIDTTFLISKWSPNDMIITQIGNKPIIYAKNMEEWVKASANNKPAYCHYEFNPNKGVLYNGHALSNDNFAPYGWRIPHASDFVKLFESEKELRSKSGNWKTEPSSFSIFSAHADGYLEGEGCEAIEGTACGENSVCGFFFEKQRAVFWTGDFGTQKFHRIAFNISDFDKELWFHDSINYIDKLEKIGFIEENMISGASVRLVRNDAEFIPTFSNKYSVLMPDSYIELRDELYRRIADQLRPEDNFGSYSLNLNLRFDQNGNNLSEGIEIPGYSYDNIALDYLKKWNQSPVYRGKNLIASEEFNLRIDVKNETFVRSSIEDRISLSNEKFNRSIANTDLTFDIDYRTVDFISTMTDQNEFRVNASYLTGANGKGAANAGFSLILPGLGINKVAKSRRGFRNFLLITSAISGTTCLFSKLYSNNRYKTYKSLDSHNEKIYNTANNFQKVSLISGGAYGALMLLDISATIRFGIKNKKDQRNINQYIKLESSNGIRLK